MAWSTSASAVSFLAERTDLPLLRGVADGVERHPVFTYLRGAVLLHQCSLEKLPDVAGFALVHGRLVRKSDLDQILRICFRSWQ